MSCCRCQTPLVAWQLLGGDEALYPSATISTGTEESRYPAESSLSVHAVRMSARSQGRHRSAHQTFSLPPLLTSSHPLRSQRIRCMVPWERLGHKSLPCWQCSRPFESSTLSNPRLRSLRLSNQIIAPSKHGPQGAISMVPWERLELSIPCGN